MAATLWTKKTQIVITTAGEGSNQTAVYLPGANATKTNYIAGGATSDSAFADAGWMPIEVGGDAYVMPMYLNS